MNNYLTEADEIELVHLIKNVVEENVEYAENQDGYGQVRQIRELIRRIQKIELVKGSSASEIPQGLRETMKYLKEKAISEYLPSLTEALDEDYQEETALDEKCRLTPTLREFMTEQDAHEQIQKHIVWLRDLIIESGEERLYEICRFFFCAQNTCDSERALKRRMSQAKIPSSWWDEIFKKFYAQTTSLQGTVSFCPYCGKLLTDNHFETSPVCRYFQQESETRQPIVKTFSGSEALYHLNPQVIKSIVIPNLGEQFLRDRLLEHPNVIEVVMYPFFDAYDLMVKTKTQTYWLDVKDYRFPFSLVHYFMREEQQAKKLSKPTQEGVEAKNVFLIVPKHRVKMASRDYMSKLKQGLMRVNIKAKSEDEFIHQFLD